METNQDNNRTELIINEQTKNILLSSTKWTRFLAVIGYIGACLIALATIVGIINRSNSYKRYGSYNNYGQFFDGHDTIYTLLIFILCGVYVVISNYLMSYANNMSKAIQYNDNSCFQLAFGSLKNHFKTIGIIVIVYLSLIVLFILMGLFLFVLDRS